MTDVYTPTNPTEADLYFYGVYTPSDMTLRFEPDTGPSQSLLYQICADEDYVFCATEDGLGIIPLN